VRDALVERVRGDRRAASNSMRGQGTNMRDLLIDVVRSDRRAASNSMRGQGHERTRSEARRHA
jgi:hypothetical protein